MRAMTAENFDHTSCARKSAQVSWNFGQIGGRRYLYHPCFVEEHTGALA
jgi:hypothetical protein